MNIESYVAKQNKEQANALYEQERAKTKSAQYLDYFIKWNSYIETLINDLNTCVANYEKCGNELAGQIKFVTPHAKLLRAYAGVLGSFITTLQENADIEKKGGTSEQILKMRNVDNIDLLFAGLTKEIDFVKGILAGEFDVATNSAQKKLAFTQRLQEKLTRNR